MAGLAVFACFGFLGVLAFLSTGLSPQREWSDAASTIVAGARKRLKSRLGARISAPSVRSDQGPRPSRLDIGWSSVLPSKYKASRVYVTLDGHYTDDYKPYVFVSDD